MLVADDDRIAQLAAAHWRRRALHGDPRVMLLSGGLAAWTAAGHAVEATPELPADSECIDYLFFVHDRHDGNQAAARQYLAWETGLLAQLDAQELSGFKLGAHAAQP